MGAAVSVPTAARNGVAAVFALNGLLFASLVSRVPDLRGDLRLDNGGLGLLLLTMAVGSLVALPASGGLVARLGAATVVRGGALLTLAGVGLASVGAQSLGSVPVVSVGLFLYGAGTGAWDVAMNVEGAEVERGLGRSVMPRFHAAFSLGTIGGAGVGIAAVAASAPMLLHLGVLAGGVLAAAVVGTASFLPVRPPDEHRARPRSAWREPRTLVVGVMVLAFAVTEGSANDWLAVALIDGYDAPHWLGVAGFALFVTAMTLGRLTGTWVLDRLGRAPTLWATTALSAVGLVLVVRGEVGPLVAVGIVLWGLGASLGFPVGMSAAADDPDRAAARVAVVSTIGYAAFLAGPPLLGWLADRVGTLDSLLAVAALMGPAAAAVSVTRRPATSR